MAVTFDIAVESKDECIEWPVVIKSPKNGGGYDDVEVKMRLLRVNKQEWDDLIEREEEEGEDPLMHLVRGWADDVFKGPSGPLNYSDENKELVLSDYSVRSAVQGVYLKWMASSQPEIFQAKKPRKRGRRK